MSTRSTTLHPGRLAVLLTVLLAAPAAHGAGPKAAASKAAPPRAATVALVLAVAGTESEAKAAWVASARAVGFYVDAGPGLPAILESEKLVGEATGRSALVVGLCADRSEATRVRDLLVASGVAGARIVALKPGLDLVDACAKASLDRSKAGTDWDEQGSGPVLDAAPSVEWRLFTRRRGDAQCPWQELLLRVSQGSGVLDEHVFQGECAYLMENDPGSTRRQSTAKLERGAAGRWVRVTEAEDFIDSQGHVVDERSSSCARWGWREGSVQFEAPCDAARAAAPKPEPEEGWTETVTEALDPEGTVAHAYSQPATGCAATSVLVRYVRAGKEVRRELREAACQAKLTRSWQVHLESQGADKRGVALVEFIGTEAIAADCVLLLGDHGKGPCHTR